jgi:hypothetical protein
MDPIDVTQYERPRFDVIQVDLYGPVLYFTTTNGSMAAVFVNVDNEVLLRVLQFCERCVDCGKDG